MDLVPCPQCGRQLSDEATSCPQCGQLVGLVPLAEPFEPIPPPKGLSTARPERRKPPTSLNFGRISALVLVGMVLVAVAVGSLLWLGVLR